MAKLTENSFRDVNIAFANELSIICDKQGINVWELISLANRHPRVDILQPGPGVGGHCIAVDPWFVVSQSPKEARLIRTAREVNEAKPKWVIEKINATIGRCLVSQPNKTAKEITLVCFGLAFKSDIDDLRESPALEIVKQLAAIHSGPVLVVEPNIETLPTSLRGIAKLISVSEGIARADVGIMLVDHKEFKAVPVGQIEHLKLVDTRGVWG
jgi:UDP-N-acetyl-D-mannosaminuronic acid dehydrogenase